MQPPSVFYTEVPAPAEHLRSGCSCTASASCCSWAAYVAGTLLVLMHECGARVPPGMHLCALVASDVPPGAGVSSSAALEVASMTAFAAALQLDLPPRQLAILCQMVCAFPLSCHHPWQPKCRCLHSHMHAELVAWRGNT
jgi:galactokinase